MQTPGFCSPWHIYSIDPLPLCACEYDKSSSLIKLYYMEMRVFTDVIKLAFNESKEDYPRGSG